MILTGPLPTPGVAFVTKSMRADAGVMISASHNHFSDNGIKLFDHKGIKLPDEVELKIEHLVLNTEEMPVMTGGDLGRARRLDEVFGRYIVHVKSFFDQDYDLGEMRIVLDCANGASYQVAPKVFSELGAEVFGLGVSPNGRNINDQCGALYPADCQEKVKKYRADIGICLDGDADRLVVVDEKGNRVDGDQLLGIFARLLVDQGELKKGDWFIGTVMSNLGLENYIKSLGLKFHRTQVGDRYITEAMQEKGAILGGEPSGHIIFGRYAATGDGTLAALKVIECLRYYKKTLSELVGSIKLFPQKMTNVPVNSRPPLDEVEGIKKGLIFAENKLKERGRVVLRYSGTENLARIMVEGEEEKVVDEVLMELEEVVQRELSPPKKKENIVVTKLSVGAAH